MLDLTFSFGFLNENKCYIQYILTLRSDRFGYTVVYSIQRVLKHSESVDKLNLLYICQFTSTDHFCEGNRAYPELMSGFINLFYFICSFYFSFGQEI